MTDKNPNILVKTLMLLWYAVSHPLVVLWKKVSAFFMRLDYPAIGNKVVHGVGNFFH